MKQTPSEHARDLLAQDAAIATWWASSIECASAIARLERDGLMTRDGAGVAWSNLRAAALNWVDIPATAPVREQATRLVRVHPLRAADALQLAAAIVAADFQPSTMELVTLDRRLATAAEREGFTVLK